MSAIVELYSAYALTTYDGDNADHVLARHSETKERNNNQ
jgi:hypothetical protein